MEVMIEEEALGLYSVLKVVHILSHFIYLIIS